MPKLVEFGDDVIEFPDDMPDDQIARVLGGSKTAAKPEPSLPKDVEGMGPAARFGMGLVRPAVGLAKMAGEATRAAAGLQRREDGSLSPAPLGQFQTGAEMLWETLKGIGQASADRLGRAKAIHDAAANDDPYNPRTLLAEAGQTAAAIPLVGPAVADLVERAMAGDVAGAAGEVAFNALPIGRIANAAGSKAAGALKSSAAKNVMNVLSPTAKQAIEAEKIVPRVADDLGVGSRETLLNRAEAKLSEAAEGTAALRKNTTPIDLKAVIDELRARAKQGTALPEREVATTVNTGILDEAGNPITKQGSKKVGGHVEVDPEQSAAYERSARKLEEINEGFEGQVPAGEAFKQAAAFRKKAQRGGAYGRAADANPISPKAISARDADALIKDMIKERVPDAKKALESYRDWKRTRDLMHKALGKDVSPQKMNGFEVAAYGRLAASAAAVGGITAGVATGSVPLLAVGSGALVYAASKNAFWNSLSGSVKRKVAKAIEAGGHVAAQKELEAAAKSWVAAERERSKRSDVEAKLKESLGIE
jgi:hypothetical protein